MFTPSVEKLIAKKSPVAFYRGLLKYPKHKYLLLRLNRLHALATTVIVDFVNETIQEDSVKRSPLWMQLYKHVSSLHCLIQTSLRAIYFASVEPVEQPSDLCSELWCLIRPELPPPFGSKEWMHAGFATDDVKKEISQMGVLGVRCMMKMLRHRWTYVQSLDMSCFVHKSMEMTRAIVGTFCKYLKTLGMDIDDVRRKLSGCMPPGREHSVVPLDLYYMTQLAIDDRLLELFIGDLTPLEILDRLNTTFSYLMAEFLDTNVEVSTWTTRFSLKKKKKWLQETSEVVMEATHHIEPD